MKFGELLIRNGHSDKTINVKPGDTLHTEDGLVLEVVLDSDYPCIGKCALSHCGLHLQGGGYICCATFGCTNHGSGAIHLEVKGGK